MAACRYILFTPPSLSIDSSSQVDLWIFPRIFFTVLFESRDYSRFSFVLSEKEEDTSRLFHALHDRPLVLITEIGGFTKGQVGVARFLWPVINRAFSVSYTLFFHDNGE